MGNLEKRGGEKSGGGDKSGGGETRAEGVTRAEGLGISGENREGMRSLFSAIIERSFTC